jgi:hypothetical protein
MNSASALQKQIRVTRGLLEQAENKLALMKINTGNPDNELVLKKAEKEELAQRKNENKVVILKKIYKNNEVRYLFRYNNEIVSHQVLSMRDFTDEPFRVTCPPDFFRKLRIYKDYCSRDARFTILESDKLEDDSQTYEEIETQQFLEAEEVYDKCISAEEDGNDQAFKEIHDEFQEKYGVCNSDKNDDIFFLGLFGKKTYVYGGDTVNYSRQYMHYAILYENENGTEWDKPDDDERGKRARFDD